MYDWQTITLYAIQFIVIAILLKIIMNEFITYQHSHLFKRLRHVIHLHDPPLFLTRLFAVKQEKLNSRHALYYKRCGFSFPYQAYCIYRKLAIGMMYIAILLSIGLYVLLFPYRAMFSLGTTFAVLLCALHLDALWLKGWMQVRNLHITSEIYHISHQLLYFADSKANVYNKLRKCVPHTKVLRRELEILLIEWLQNTEYAIQNFKQRLGTDDAISFVETINALRQDQNEEFYTLLRERIEEYKEKIEIARDSRKETTSYILFVLSAVPILYTFQVFIYPWVSEVQHLLSSLN